MLRSLVGSEMCIRDRYQRRVRGGDVGIMQPAPGEGAPLPPSPIRRLQLQGAINGISTSPNGRLACVGGRDVLKVVSISEDDGELEEKKNLRVGKTNLSYSAYDVKWHFSYSDLVATAATNGAVVIWNLEKARKQEAVFHKHTRTVNRVSWHKTDPHRLISGSQDASTCLLYTSDAADEEDSVDLGGRRIIKKKKKGNQVTGLRHRTNPKKRALTV
eukprot:TRINITY_DN22062_c0_g2_i2.p1 TRINITY_DN22062_c0_g2~~TRINITY_DN22062_c0_g2_i2.p1  ORF type:complete len:236 (+),score=79.06 TRINITY_DN22062_c0_g2_i2:63-710(+)